MHNVNKSPSDMFTAVDKPEQVRVTGGFGNRRASLPWKASTDDDVGLS